MLPVEAGNESRYGDGLLEVKKDDLQNRYEAVFVAPTFSHLPWYADHPTDPEIRQEAYLLKVVLPFVEKQYPVRHDAERAARCSGFSKSGWGAFSLLLRHPDVFGRAAAWDAPLMMDAPGKYGSGDIFGTKENFEEYQITKLLEQRAADLKSGKRLVLLGLRQLPRAPPAGPRPDGEAEDRPRVPRRPRAEARMGQRLAARGGGPALATRSPASRQHRASTQPQGGWT